MSEVLLPVTRFVAAVAEPVSIAFATSSSEAALLLAMELASVFVAQAAGSHLSPGRQLGTAASFGRPKWPILAILGSNELMEMARTSLNVIGNCLATTVVARWEGDLAEPA